MYENYYFKMIWVNVDLIGSQCNQWNNSINGMNGPIWSSIELYVYYYVSMIIYGRTFVNNTTEKSEDCQRESAASEAQHSFIEKSVITCASSSQICIEYIFEKETAVNC